MLYSASYIVTYALNFFAGSDLSNHKGKNINRSFILIALAVKNPPYIGMKALSI